MDMSTLTPGFLLLFGSICLGKSIEETKLVMNRATKSTPAIELKRPTSQPRRAVQLRSEEPSSSATAVITSWGLGHPGIFYVQDLLQNNQGAAFFDPQIKNYTQMVILPQQSVIYAIANGVTVLKLDMTTYFLLDSYTIPQPDHLHPSCQDPSTCREATELSLLALMPNKQMIWFCYVHYLQHLSRPPQHIHTGCMVPQVDDLSEPLLQWENAHFSSLDPHQPVEILNANDQFTYIAGVTMDYLRIFRTHMPDWDGKVNWTQALVTDKGENHIADPATILLSFETSNEVYFVLREQYSQSTTHPRNKRRSTRLSHGSDKPVVNVATAARLVRICKGDRGGLPHVSADAFATFAKADLLCQASDEEGNYFFYTQVTSAFWDNSTQRLYAAFTTEKWAPMGSALCVYPKENIENAFSGPLLLSNIVGISRPPSPVPNSFPNICERFNAANLTAAELSIGRRMSLSFPNRYNAIEPLYKRAVLMQTGPEWIHLQVYDLPALPIHYHFGNPVRTTMIWLGTRNSLTRVVLYEAGITQVVCKLGELHTGQALNLLAQTIQGNPPSSVNYDPVEEVRNLKVTLDKLFIATNRQVLWLPLTDCSRYTTYDDCMASKDPYCGWSWPYGQCVNGYASSMSPNSNWYNTYSPSVDRRRPVSAHCPVGRRPRDRQANSWSEWYPCRWFDTDTKTALTATHEEIDETNSRPSVHGKCLCRICLNPTACAMGSQEVANCTRFENGWLHWSPWSPCDLRTGAQTRYRKCPPNAVCVGSSQDHRSCSPSSSYWFQPVEISAARQRATPGRDAKSGLFASTHSSDGVSMTLLMLVAFCCFFVGAFVPTVTFLLFPLSCNRTGTKHHSKVRPIYHKRRFCGCLRTYIDRPSIYITDADKPWCDDNDLADPQGLLNNSLHKDVGYYKIPNGASSLKRSLQPSHNRLTSQSRSSQQFLIIGTPLPSPTSVLSNPSTASTMIKDRFLFDISTDATYDGQETNSQRPMTKPIIYSEVDTSQLQFGQCSSIAPVTANTMTVTRPVAVMPNQVPVPRPVQFPSDLLRTWKSLSQNRDQSRD